MYLSEAHGQWCSSDQIRIEVAGKEDGETGTSQQDVCDARRCAPTALGEPTFVEF